MGLIRKVRKLEEHVNNLKFNENKLDKLNEDIPPVLKEINKLRKMMERIDENVKLVEEQLSKEFEVSQLHALSHVTGTNFVIDLHLGSIKKSLVDIKKEL